ncbi:MAG: FKBP-type peptidyl-prolyl cis-trans isomerase [Saprospiraceae bacterium]|nr:FKBP-type peptidyl-prolyl cis-trans isomerase [Saprospiraceae bacterium]
MRNWIIGLAALGCLAACNNSTSTIESKALNSQLDSVAYSIGVNVGKNMQVQKMDDVDPAIVAAAINDVLKDNELKITEDDIRTVIGDYQKAKFEELKEENKEKGATFLAENKDKEGVFTTESGLQYKVIVDGNGPKPTLNDRVSCHYEGKLLDGTVFDSSIQRGTPSEFNVNGVIAGWTEALQLMPVGSKWELYIPYEIAYRENGNGRGIGPAETLLFELELLDIVN